MCEHSFDHDTEFLAVSSEKGTIHVFKIGASGASMDKGSAGRKGGKKKGKDENSKSRSQQHTREWIASLG